MYPVPAPPSTSLPGELPLEAGEEEKEHHEKRPVLKKVMDKVKKIKKAISKKTPGHGNEGCDDDNLQDGDLDEVDEEYEEDEEIKEDPAVHGVPISSVGIGTNKMSGGEGEGTKRAVDGLSLILEHPAKSRTYPETDTIIEQNQISPNVRIEQTRENESPAIGATTGAKEISEGGGKGVDGVSDGLRLPTQNFVGDIDPPTTEAKTNISREYENPATSVGTAANEMSGGGREAAEGVGDGLGMMKEEFVEDSGVPRNEGETNVGIEQSRGFPLYESPATVARTGANDILGGGEVAERVNDGLGLITKEFIEDPTAPTADFEMNTRNEQSRGSPFNLSGRSEGAKGVDVFVKRPAAARNDDEADTRNERSQDTGARTRANEMLGGDVESAKGVDDGSGLITKDFVKDPATPRTDDETDTRIEQSRVHLSPTSGDVRTTVNEIYGGVEAEEGVGDGLGLIQMEFVEDPAAPKIEAGTDTKSEQSQGGEVIEVSPKLCRSLEAMSISTKNDKGETELSKDNNNSYTEMVSSAASKVYEIVADAGSTVISKVKPYSGKVGEGEEVGKQGKGISIMEYITGKLTPGEDEKALSELITEGRQSRKNAVVEVPPPEKRGSEEGEMGVGVAGKIRETCNSFLGGGESSPKSPATEAHRKGASCLI